MFICKATCSIQLILLRMSHPQATYSTFEVGSGWAPGGECGGAENTAEPSQPYWFSVTLFHNRRHYLVKETVNLTHPSPAITAAQGSASESSVLTGRAQVFAVFSQNLFAGKKNKCWVPQKTNWRATTESDKQTGSQTYRLSTKRSSRCCLHEDGKGANKQILKSAKQQSSLLAATKGSQLGVKIGLFCEKHRPLLSDHWLI